MRLTSTWGVLAVACLAAVGCGGDDAGGPLRVEIVPFAADPAPPTDGWTLRTEGGRSLRLVATGQRTSRGLLFEATGPEGRLALHGPEPWGLVGGPTPVPMRPGLDPVALGVGRRHTIYLLPGEGRRVGRADVRQAPRAGTGGEPIPFERADGADGRAALRVPPAAWSGVAQVRWTIGDGAFALQDGLALAADGTPTGAGARLAPTQPVTVHVVPAVPDGAPLRLDVAWGAVSVSLEASAVGRDAAEWPTAPLQGDDATVRRGDATWPITMNDLARGEVRLVAAAPRDGSGAVIRLPEAPRGALVVQARPDGSPSYGLVADVAPEPGGGATLAWRVPLAPGRWRLLVADDERAGASAPFDVAPGVATPVDVPFEPLSTVRATIDGGVAPSRRLECFTEREEDGVFVAAHGWADRVIVRPELELHLPRGTYRLRLVEGRRTAPPAPIVLDRPSTRASLRLTLPR